MAAWCVMNHIVRLVWLLWTDGEFRQWGTDGWASGPFGYRYNLEPTSEAGHFAGSGYGNWSPGPWRKLLGQDLPWVYSMTPDTLYQVRAPQLEKVGTLLAPFSPPRRYVSLHARPKRYCA